MKGDDEASDEEIEFIWENLKNFFQLIFIWKERNGKYVNDH